jgi:riboflavin synthase
LFTGLVEEKGRVISLVASGAACDLMVRCAAVVSDATIGDSIAVNGCCLTVTSIDGSNLTFQAGAETLSRTNLGLLKVGDSVNLERSLKVGARMGGHYVTGHVDAVGVVESREDDGQWSTIWFRVPQHLTRQMASKGSITVDGISLTLVEVKPDRFSVALIPHTLDVTTLGQRKVGDQVNIETDLLAKYVEQQLSHRMSCQEKYFDH